MTEVAVNPDRLNQVPAPLAIDAIRQRLLSVASIGEKGLAAERADNDPGSAATKATRPRDRLSPQDRSQSYIIDSTVINLHQLATWLKMRNLKTFESGPYRLERDITPIPELAPPSPEARIVQLSAEDPRFNLSYALYGNDEFDLHIDFKEAGLRRLPYKVNRKPIRGDMTAEEAEIIGFYALNFLDTAKAPQKSAA